MRITSLIMIASTLSFLSCRDEEMIVPDGLDINGEITHVSTYGGSDGAIHISIPKENSSMNYFWNNGATTQNIQGIMAGAYTLKIISGENGIMLQSETFTVTEPAPYAFNYTLDTTLPSRWGRSNGILKINISNGVPPYRYRWYNSSGTLVDTLSQATNLQAGNYKLIFHDANSYKPVYDSLTIQLSQPAFVCGVDSVRDVDNNVYPTVQIGNQCWTTVNLRTKKNPDNPGEDIIGRYCYSTNCLSEMGAHYTWEAMMNGSATATSAIEEIQGICPDGFHLPTKAMWDTLQDALGGVLQAPAKMRGSPSTSGFNALYANDYGFPIVSKDRAVFWSSSENPTNNSQGWYRMVTDTDLFFYGGYVIKSYGLSVRCILNSDE